MYNNLTIYYLNQIGIKPWIIKKNSDLASINQHRCFKLLVFISPKQTEKAQVLLKRMIALLNLEDPDWLIVNIDPSEFEPMSSKKVQIQLENISTLAILSLGLDDINLREVNLNCPVFSSFSPEYLLKNPSQKKRVFKELNYIKRLVS